MSASADAPLAENASASDGPRPVDPLATLIGRLRNADEAALRQLRMLTAARLYAIARRILQCDQDAEEVVADVLLWLWDHPDRYNAERGQALAWLSKLTWNRALDRRRSRQRRTDGPHPGGAQPTYAERQDACNDPAQWQEHFESGERIAKALQALSAGQRQSIILAYVDGLSHAEVAARQGRPLGTVKSDIRRGLRRLRLSLG